MRSRHLRWATTLGLIPVMLASVAFVGSSAFGKPKPSAAQYQYKVTICHRTKSAKKPGVTIRVSSRALPAHMRHGDSLGPCTAPSVSATATTSSSTKGKGKGKGQQSQSQGNGKGKNK